MQPFRIRNRLGIEAVIQRAYALGGSENRTPDDVKQADSLLGLGETSRFAVDSGVVSFPVAVSFPDQPGAPPAQPDGLMRWPRGEIAVEVTRVTWDKLWQVLETAREDHPGAAGEMATELCASGKADGRRAKRTGDYRHIKRPGERFDARGFGGDEAERLAVEALRNRVSSQARHLPSYRRSAGQVWLFLVDDSLPEEFRRILDRDDLRLEIESLAGAAVSSDALFPVYWRGDGP